VKLKFNEVNVKYSRQLLTECHLLIISHHCRQNILDCPLHQNSANHSEAFSITVNFFQCFNYQPTDHSWNSYIQQNMQGTNINVLWTRNCRILCWADPVCTHQMAVLCCMNGIMATILNVQCLIQTGLRHSMHIYLKSEWVSSFLMKSNRAKFHSNLIRNDRALGSFW